RHSSGESGVSAPRRGFGRPATVPPRSRRRWATARRGATSIRMLEQSGGLRMPVGRMVLLFWILYAIFLIAALAVGGAVAPAGSSLLVVLLVFVIAACVGSFVYAMYLNLRVQRGGDPRLLRRGVRGTALVLAAKQTNTVIQEGDFTWQAPFVW